MSAGLELNIANPIVLPFQSAGMSMMCPPCPEVLEHFAFGTHTALFITIVNNYSVGFQMQKRKYFVFWTFTHSLQPGRGNLFDILRNQAFSLRQRTFSGKILRSAEKVLWWTILVPSLDRTAFIRSGQDDPNVSLSPN